MRASAFGRCVVFVAGLALAAIPRTVEGEVRGGIAFDPASGLAWTADPEFVVSAGAATRLRLPRAEALAVVSAMNRGEAANLGFTDWRLPTPSEERARRAAYRSGAVAGSEPMLAHRPGVPAADGLVLAWPVRASGILPGLSDVVILGANSVRLKNDALVASGDVVANDASPGPTLQPGYELTLDPGAATAAATRAFGDSVRLKARSRIQGDLAYNELNAQGSISGATITPIALPVFAVLPAFPPPAPGTVDVDVAAGSLSTLAAGPWGHVVVGDGATLVLSGGVYDIASLSLGAAAQVFFEAATDVRIAGRIASRADATVGPAAGSSVPPHDVILHVAGIDGSDGLLGSEPRAVEIGPRALVGANLYAPNGTIRLGQGGDLTGAVLARDVLIENRARVALDSAFFNRAPEAGDDDAEVDEGGTVAMLASGETSLLANDVDPNFGDLLTVSPAPVSGPDHGSIVLAADGTFSYTHDGSETTSDAVVYEVCDDGTPSLCDTAVLTITVNPINDPPVAVDDAATVVQGGTASILDSGAASVLANDTDAEGNTLTATLLTPPSHGTVVLSPDGTFVYTHDAGETFADAFEYEACDDGSPSACDTATVTIAVRAPITVTILRFGLGEGVVTSSPTGLDCGAVCVATFAPGGPITLTATALGTSVFAGFGGDADCADGVLQPDGDKVCSARFDASSVPAVLTVTTAGAGAGTVVSDPGGIACPGACSAGFPIPTRVRLEAIPAPGSLFAGWSGAADCLDGTVDLFGDTTCTATFEPEPPPPPSYELTIVFLGPGPGTVTSNPAGAYCTGTCTATFPQGTAVTLAGRADGGGLPTWGGDCADTGVQTTLTLDADKSCTVSFP